MRELKLLLLVNAPQEAFHLPASAISTHAVQSTAPLLLAALSSCPGCTATLCRLTARPAR